MKESTKESIKEYLYFTKTERIGAIALLCMFIAVIYCYKTYANQPPKVDPMLILQQEMAELKLELKNQQQQSSYSTKQQYSDNRSKEYRSYNNKSAYPSKKKNRKPSSKRNPKKYPIQKTNSQTTNDKHRQPPVAPKASGKEESVTSVSDSSLPGFNETASAPADFSKTKDKRNRKPVKKFRKPLKVDINKATTETFQRLYGIGPAYSNRIVKFREALGGFHAVHQVSEVYGLPDSTFQSIQPNLEISPVILGKININTATKDELAFHPYLHWKQAKIIVAYREMHGNFKLPDDLKKIHGIEVKMIEKMMPYFDFNVVEANLTDAISEAN